MYSNTRPVEHKSILTYQSIPVCSRLIVFKSNHNFALRVIDPFISFDVKNRAIRISKSAVTFMKLSAGNRLHFIAMNEYIYCCQANVDGNKLTRATRGDMLTKNAGFLDHLKKYFKANESFRCEIKKTKSEFDGNPLYEMVLPRRLKHTYFLYQ